MDFSVKFGIAPEHQTGVARLYAMAFQSKFSKILGPPDEVIRLFSRGINPERGFTAVSSDQELVGIAGFQLDGTSLVDVRMRNFIRQYGFFRGIYKATLLDVIFQRKPDDPKQLLMDGIVVEADYRGRGIGSKLFKALEEFAFKNHMTSLKLDVIDENPNAKKLYQKIGFASVKHQRVPRIIAKLIGVSGVTTMVKTL